MITEEQIEDFLKRNNFGDPTRSYINDTVAAGFDVAIADFDNFDFIFSSRNLEAQFTNDLGYLAKELYWLGRGLDVCHEIYPKILNNGNYHKGYEYFQLIINQTIMNLLSLSYLLNGTPVAVVENKVSVWTDTASCLTLARAILEKLSTLNWMFLSTRKSDEVKLKRYLGMRACEYLKRCTNYQFPDRPEWQDSYKAALQLVQQLKDKGEVFENEDWLSDKVGFKGFLRIPKVRERLDEFELDIYGVPGFNYYEFYSIHAHGNLISSDDFGDELKDHKPGKYLYTAISYMVMGLSKTLFNIIEHFPELEKEFMDRIPHEALRTAQLYINESAAFARARKNSKV
jgi:hypothetical protein